MNPELYTCIFFPFLFENMELYFFPNAVLHIINIKLNILY
jgi:hypothetical protein